MTGDGRVTDSSGYCPGKGSTITERTRAASKIAT